MYIYRSANRYANFGVAVLKASILDWGCQSAMCNVHCAIYENLFVVMVLQRSMFYLKDGGTYLV